jgi:hypothetical protein
MTIAAEGTPAGIKAIRKAVHRAIRRAIHRVIRRAIRRVIRRAIRFPQVHPDICHSSSNNNNNFSNGPITPITDHHQVGREDRLNNQCINLQCMLARAHGLVAAAARHRLVGDLDRIKWAALALVWWT